MPEGMINMAYVAASILFILALGGLSNQETARRGNYFGMTGMVLALIATIMGVVTDNYLLMMAALLAGGTIGYILAKKVQMTQMPELVAMLHSLVGLAAVLVGFGTFLDHPLVADTIPAQQTLAGAEQTIHNVEIYLGILIGALTFSGSVTAYLKLITS
jgi:NAD(P) transhydrogenase subunit beta